MTPAAFVTLAKSISKASPTSHHLLSYEINVLKRKGTLRNVKDNKRVALEKFLPVTTKRFIATIVYTTYAIDGHAMLMLLDRKRKRVMVFDNHGTRSRLAGIAADVIVRGVVRGIEEVDRFEDMSACPLHEMDSGGGHCAWWALAFFEYILRRPWGTIEGFQRFVTNSRHPQASPALRDFICKYQGRARIQRAIERFDVNGDGLVSIAAEREQAVGQWEADRKASPRPPRGSVSRKDEISDMVSE